MSSETGVKWARHGFRGNSENPQMQQLSSSSSLSVSPLLLEAEGRENERDSAQQKAEYTTRILQGSTSLEY